MQLFRFTVQLEIQIKTKTKQNVNFLQVLKTQKLIVQTKVQDIL
jgi:hypothetical protein